MLRMPQEVHMYLKCWYNEMVGHMITMSATSTFIISELTHCMITVCRDVNIQLYCNKYSNIFSIRCGMQC